MSDEAALADLVEHYLALRREGKAPAPKPLRPNIRNLRNCRVS